MSDLFSYFKKDADKEFNKNSMIKYAENKQELDKFLESLITPYIKNKKLSMLDACCGVGHLSDMLSKISPESSFLGVDNADYLIQEAKELFGEQKNMTFEAGDLNDLPTKYPKAFDISIIWKTLSWLPYYEEALRSLVAVTRDHIFLSSLFYDGDIDFEIKVREYKKEGGKDSFNAYYNVYSYPRFKDFVLSLGAKNVDAFDFEIGIDLPKQSTDFMHTYTEKLANGKRLQISGAVVMSWKIVRVDL